MQWEPTPEKSDAKESRQQQDVATPRRTQRRATNAAANSCATERAWGCVRLRAVLETAKELVCVCVCESCVTKLCVCVFVFV